MKPALLFLVLLVFVSGCFSGNVDFVFVNSSEHYENSSDSSAQQNVYFIANNSGGSGADCFVNLILVGDNFSNSSIYDIGFVGAHAH